MSAGIVGSVVGPISALPVGAASSLSDVGQGYDVAIGGLGFKLKVGDQTPYERATAQFRKEQFDNSGTYGDQSLLGYWTRGQFSFHRGAGVRYYEVSDGETVLNRFRDGEGVNPFEPGALTLQPAWEATTSGSFAGITYGGSGKSFIAFLDSGVLKHATSLTGATTSYAPSAGTVTHATTGPLAAYVATDASKIERVAIATGSPVDEVLYTHTVDFNGIFYAKDRLWVVDVDGVWYQLSPNPTGTPVAIAAGDKVFTAGDGWDSSWCLTDTPGAVLIGNGSRVYAVTIGDDGAVPTLSGPIQVAELPTGEVLRGLTYHLGFLCMATSAGFRVGVVADNGSVTYGPLLVEWDAASPGTTLARRGSSVFVAGGSTPAMYQVDLAQQIGQTLEFGWVKHTNPYSGSPATFGAFTYDGTTVVAWADGSPKYEGTDLAETGSLTTGFHRFGTLEPKKFQTVKVRVSGGAGTVAIYRVMSDDSEVSLLTIDLSATDGEDITLGLDTPLEMVGLKFVLSRDAGDATTGPTLLGYQLRALPAPRRQRLIRLPLMLQDVERRGTSRASGYEGAAWDRLLELEEMEQSGGTFAYQDFRTGEAGTVYIEAVEHRGITPPGKQSNGFGGIVFVTLRKL
jgi:hypothetical protein